MPPYLDAQAYICDFISVRKLLKLSIYQLLEFEKSVIVPNDWEPSEYLTSNNLQFNIYIENTRWKVLLPTVDSVAADHGFLIAVTRGIWSYLFAVKQISNTGSDHIPIQYKRYQMYIQKVNSIFFIFQGI